MHPPHLYVISKRGISMYIINYYISREYIWITFVGTLILI